MRAGGRAHTYERAIILPTYLQYSTHTIFPHFLSLSLLLFLNDVYHPVLYVYVRSTLVDTVLVPVPTVFALSTVFSPFKKLKQLSSVLLYYCS